MISVKLECVYVGHPGDEELYEMKFHDTEKDEISDTLSIAADGTIALHFTEQE